MWRTSDPKDDPAIIRMCVSLNEEDPGPEPVPPENMRRTLEAFRGLPLRGACLVLDLQGQPSGYALIIPFWSNELGGEVCAIDELYVKPGHRRQGHAARLIEDLASGRVPLASRAIALVLEISPDNIPARRLYERLGFRGRNLAMRRLLSPKDVV
jgi:ribosomal protein S18 acetylase RimI-like enzyme